MMLEECKLWCSDKNIDVLPSTDVTRDRCQVSRGHPLTMTRLIVINIIRGTSQVLSIGWKLTEQNNDGCELVQIYCTATNQ